MENEYSRELEFLQTTTEREQKIISGAEFDIFSFVFYSQTSNDFLAVILESI